MMTSNVCQWLPRDSLLVMAGVRYLKPHEVCNFFNDYLITMVDELVTLKITNTNLNYIPT